jgi:excisionase family DNA binding protein
LTTRITLRYPELMLPTEVATVFGVDAKTVTRWAKAGKLTSIRTLGGHRRYMRSEIEDFLNQPTERAR